MRRSWLSVVQLIVAFGLIFFGAALIGLWAVGLMLIVAGGLLVADALLHDSTRDSVAGGSPDEVLERWRRAR